MRISDKVWEIVKEYTDTVFYLPGGGAMWLVDSLGKSGLTYVTWLCHDEKKFGSCASYIGAR
jgi:thiamine pyrophosphate-dependent acetolactate synthase large subunit-like protein